MALFDSIATTAPNFGLEDQKRPVPLRPRATPMAPGIDPVAAAALDAQKPLIAAEVAGQQADTELKQVGAEAAKFNLQQKMKQRFQHRISGGAITGAKFENNLTTPRDLRAAVTPGAASDPTSLVARTAGSASTPTSSVVSAPPQRPTGAPVPIRPSARPPMVTAAPNASKGGVPGSANIVSGEYGSGFGFTPSRPASTVMRPALRPKRVSQSAIVNPRVNPLFKTQVA